jgi:hypothetical protein
MANRTIQFYGSALVTGGSVPITITTSLGGNTVFSGTIPTMYTGNISLYPEDQVVLFSFELPIDYVANTVPMTISIDNHPNGGAAFFEQILSNYMPVRISGNIVSSGPDSFYPVSTDNNLAPLDPRSNVVINGTPVTSSPPPNGTWGWTVDFLAGAQGTLNCDIKIDAGLA